MVSGLGRLGDFELAATMRSAAPLLVGFFFGWPADASYRICVPEARHVLGPENSQWFLAALSRGAQDLGRWTKEMGSICAVERRGDHRSGRAGTDRCAAVIGGL